MSYDSEGLRDWHGFRSLADCDDSASYWVIRRVSLTVFLSSRLHIPGQEVVVYVINLVVEAVSADLVIIGELGTGIVVRPISTVVLVRVTGTVEIVDSFVITVEVTGQVVVLLKWSLHLPSESWKVGSS